MLTLTLTPALAAILADDVETLELDEGPDFNAHASALDALTDALKAASRSPGGATLILTLEG